MTESKSNFGKKMENYSETDMNTVMYYQHPIELLTGTRPALSMSHPVCYPAPTVAAVIGHQQSLPMDEDTEVMKMSPSSQKNKQQEQYHQQHHHSMNMGASSLMEQNMLEGRLVIPDASTLPSSSMSTNINNNNNNNKIMNINNNNASINNSSVTTFELSPEESFAKLQEALSLESKFQPSLYLPQESLVSTYT